MVRLGPSPPSSLIATLGTEPQVVTTALALLDRQGVDVRRVEIVHTTQPDSPIEVATQILAEAFTQGPYAQQVEFHLHPIQDEHGAHLSDVETPEAARAAFRCLFRRVRAAKRDGLQVHVSIAGGRKTLAVFGMVAAQLLFDEDDRLWHLHSAGAYLSERRLYPRPEDQVHLIAVPVIQWSKVSPLLLDLGGVEDPYQALARQQSRHLAERLEDARAFVLGALTPAEERVVALLVREGLSDREIGARLSLSSRTVEQHLRAAYQKAAAHWELDNVHRSQLITLLNFFYTTQNRGNSA